MIQTIIIVFDPLANTRGYSLLGREFAIDGVPERVEAKTVDGAIVLDNHYKIRMIEYLRVVPEAVRENWDDNWVLIPVYAAKPSFRPSYIKNTSIL